MFRNILTTAFRNLVKHRLYSSINILGLSIGFTAYILINLFLTYEYSWDKCNVNYDKIYRVQTKATLGGRDEYWRQTPAAVTDLLTEKFPEFEQVALVREAWGEYLSSKNIQPFFEPDGYYADAQLLNILTFHFLQGNQHQALADPMSIVLSKKLADKLFPGENAYGKSILVEKKFNMKVTGIYEDLPQNTVLRPTYMISIASFKTTKNWKDYRTNWGISFQNYVLLKKGTNASEVNKKIANLINTNHEDKVVQKLYLCPMSKLYLMPTDRADYMIAIYSYASLAIFLLLLASINYINLTTANASLRAKEIAVRKINGSAKASLIVQFLGETIVLSLIAVNFSLVFANLLLPEFNQIVDREIGYAYLNNWHFLSQTVGTAILVGIISGIYPAFVLSSFKPISLLRGNLFRNIKGRMVPKKILVTFQYAVAMFLIIQSLFVYKQINFMMKKDLGFTKENLLITNIRSTNENIDYEELRNKLLKHPEIIDITYSSNLPFHGNNGWPMTWEGNPTDEKIDVRFNYVSIDYVRTLQMTIVKGRDFLRDFPSDKEKACLLNEAACKRFGWKDPIGKMVDGQFRVVGVVKDFHPYSTQELIPPFLIRLRKENTCNNGMYTFRIMPGKLTDARKIVKEEMEASFPNDPFDITSFTDDFNRYGSFQTWFSINKTFFFFTVLIILLAIIGIYGLVSFSASRKTKEIGIRKVHGSSLTAIYFNLISEFLIMLAIAICFAWPAAYQMYHLIPGSYKYGLTIWEFLFATSLILVITLLTTSYQIIKVTRTNPIKALRYE